MTLAQLKQLNAAPARPDLPAQRVLTLEELCALFPPEIALALELKTDRFLEAGVCEQMVDTLTRAGMRARSVAISFSMARVQAVKRAAADIPVGLITMSRLFPPRGVELAGPFWPLALINPLYVWLGHRRGQVICPLDPTPDRRAWLYRRMGCDAILTDDPAATRRALGRG